VAEGFAGAAGWLSTILFSPDDGDMSGGDVTERLRRTSAGMATFLPASQHRWMASELAGRMDGCMDGWTHGRRPDVSSAECDS